MNEATKGRRLVEMARSIGITKEEIDAFIESVPRWHGSVLPWRRLKETDKIDLLVLFLQTQCGHDFVLTRIIHGLARNGW